VDSEKKPKVKPKSMPGPFSGPAQSSSTKLVQEEKKQETSAQAEVNSNSVKVDPKLKSKLDKSILEVAALKEQL